jgi:hypothetical protein
MIRFLKSDNGANPYQPVEKRPGQLAHATNMAKLAQAS